jgi:hypothetical protein
MKERKMRERSARQSELKVLNKMTDTLGKNHTKINNKRNKNKRDNPESNNWR